MRQQPYLFFAVPRASLLICRRLVPLGLLSSPLDSQRNSSMRLDNLRRLLERRSQQRERSRQRPSRFRYVPRADALEGRTLLSAITVTNANDSGAGSLRQAIIDARDGATIKFSSTLNGDKIILTSGELDINKNLQIAGPAPGELTVSGGGSSAVFVITTDGLNVTISGLTIADGSATSGAGIANGNG